MDVETPVADARPAERDSRGEGRALVPAAAITVWWLGRVQYRDAWDLQHRLVGARSAGTIGDQLLVLEHEPVLTLGRHSDPAHVRASAAELEARGIDVIRVERGGEVTYHGPGQLTAYPIVALSERGLLVRPFVRALEAALVETCRAQGVVAGRRDGFPGCWCDPDSARPRKVGAIGVRIERGVTYHGIALNVTVRLADFELIDACGMPEVASTSIARERGEDSDPSTASVAAAAGAFATAFTGAIGAPLVEPEPGDPRLARERLEALLAGSNPRGAGS